MRTISKIKKICQEICSATESGENTAARVGGAMLEIAKRIATKEGNPRYVVHKHVPKCAKVGVRYFFRTDPVFAADITKDECCDELQDWYSEEANMPVSTNIGEYQYFRKFCTGNPCYIFKDEDGIFRRVECGDITADTYSPNWKIIEGKVRFVKTMVFEDVVGKGLANREGDIDVKGNVIVYKLAVSRKGYRCIIKYKKDNMVFAHSLYSKLDDSKCEERFLISDGYFRAYFGGSWRDKRSKSRYEPFTKYRYKSVNKTAFKVLKNEDGRVLKLMQ